MLFRSGSLCEILFPLGMILMIVAIKNVVKDETISESNYLTDTEFAYYFDSNPLETGWMNISKGQVFPSCIRYNRFIFGVIVSNDNLYSKIKLRLEESTESIIFNYISV